MSKWVCTRWAVLVHVAGKGLFVSEMYYYPMFLRPQSGILQASVHVPNFNRMISNTDVSGTSQVFKSTFLGCCATSAQEKNCWYVPD